MMHCVDPEYEPPSARVIGGRLLTELTQMKKAEIDQMMERVRNGSLIWDGLTNIRHEHNVNYMSKFPGIPRIYLETQNTTGIRQDSHEVARSAIAVMEKYGEEKFRFCVTDTTNAMQAAWALIEAEKPNVRAYGCAAHVTNLLILDIHKDPKFDKICKLADGVVSFVNNHNFTLGKFKEIRVQENVSILKLVHYCPTRWFTLNKMLSTLLRARSVIEKMVEQYRDEIASIKPVNKSLAFVRLVERATFWD